MTTIGEKVAYVKGQRQTRNHHCHWPGCDKTRDLFGDDRC